MMIINVLKPHVLKKMLIIKVVKFVIKKELNVSNVKKDFI